MASDRPVVRYLRDLHLIHATGGGTDETSLYGPLENLLNAVGERLKPGVRAVFQLQDLGAGRPDFGLFTTDQFGKRRKWFGTPSDEGARSNLAEAAHASSSRWVPINSSPH